jgi:hypothetical protein
MYKVFVIFFLGYSAQLLRRKVWLGLTGALKIRLIMSKKDATIQSQILSYCFETIHSGYFVTHSPILFSVIWGKRPKNLRAMGLLAIKFGMYSPYIQLLYRLYSYKLFDKKISFDGPRYSQCFKCVFLPGWSNNLSLLRNSKIYYRNHPTVVRTEIIQCSLHYNILRETRN